MGIQIDTSWSPPKSLRWTIEDGRAMLAALARSDKTHQAFANEHGFKAHRIGYWRNRIREEGDGSGFKEARIVEATRVESNAATASVARRVELELGEGKTLRFVGQWTRELLVPWFEAIGAVR